MANGGCANLVPAFGLARSFFQHPTFLCGNQSSRYFVSLAHPRPRTSQLIRRVAAAGASSFQCDMEPRSRSPYLQPADLGAAAVQKSFGTCRYVCFPSTSTAIVRRFTLGGTGPDIPGEWFSKFSQSILPSTHRSRLASRQDTGKRYATRH